MLGLVALAPPLLLRDAVALVAELAVVRLREAVAFIFGVLLCLRVACCVTLGSAVCCGGFFAKECGTCMKNEKAGTRYFNKRGKRAYYIHR